MFRNYFRLECIPFPLVCSVSERIFLSLDFWEPSFCTPDFRGSRHFRGFRDFRQSSTLAVQMGGVLPHKGEAYCSTNGRCTVGFPCLQGLEARKAQRYKWGAYLLPYKFEVYCSTLSETSRRWGFWNGGSFFTYSWSVFYLQLSFFAYSPLRCFLYTLSHCKQRSSIVSRKARAVSKKAQKHNCK